MRLAANDDKLSEDIRILEVRDDRLERARKLLRVSRKAAPPNTGPLLASACLAAAALLLVSLVVGGPMGHAGATAAPTSGSDTAPSAHAMREAAPSTTPHADFELSANPGNTAPAEATPPVRDAVLIGTEGEAR
ncbi:MAG TPA: hypothetical protein VG839_01160 [Asticcacaulis sp.]|nr:hypothetical protein [Asticcacaulis sp.]